MSRSFAIQDLEKSSVGTPRLSQALIRRDSTRFNSFAMLPSNASAAEAAALFSCGLVTFAVIAGPSGWGKSHLLQCTASVMQHETRSVVPVWNAHDWLARDGAFETNQPLILDDAQEIWTSPRGRHMIRLWLDRRVRIGRPTLVAVENTQFRCRLRQLLPYYNEWMVGTIEEPASAERILLIRDMARSAGVHLADSLGILMGTRLSGNGRSIAGALHKLRCIQSSWTERADLLRACGVLQPYLAAGSGWDLRDEISESLRTYLADQPPVLPVEHMLIYAMRIWFGLGEWQVADYFYKTPGEIYAVVNRVVSDASPMELAKLRDDWAPAFMKGWESV